jgi:multicomponent Na+:H+ antiporter subunit G
MEVLEAIGGVLLIIGALFVLLAAIGVLRFDSIYARIHAGAKGPTLGILAIGLGTAFRVHETTVVVTAILVVVLQLIAGPVGAHLLGRAVYRKLRPELDGLDELADAEGR